MRVATFLKRIIQWKDHLIPPVIALVYLLFPFDTMNYPEIKRLIFYFLSLFFVSVFGYWINDSFDIELDKKSGKSNFLETSSQTFRIAGAIVTLSLAIFAWFIAAPSFIATLFFCAEVLFFTLYCLPGIRFKNHPLLGPAFDAHYTHILPVLFTWFLFVGNTFSCWILPMYILLFSKGVRNILLHQLNDRKGDKKMQLKTFPLFFGPYFTVKYINRIIIPLEIILITTISLLLLNKSVYPVIFWLGFLSVYFFFFSGWQFYFMNARYFAFKFHYFLNDYYEFWLPFLAIWASFLNFQTKMMLSVIHLLIFNKTIFYLQKLVFKIFSNLGVIKGS